MKVVHIVHSLYNYSGASNQAKNLSRYITPHDIEQCFFSVSNFLNDNNKEKSDIDVEVFESNRSISSRFIQFIRMYYKFRPDVAHFHGADFFLLVMCKLFFIKIYWKSTLYGSDDFLTLSKTRFGKFKLFLLQRINVNNALTMQMKEVNEKIIDTDKVIAIPNGVELSRTIVKKDKIALIVGAVVPRKNVLKGIEFLRKICNLMGTVLK